MERQDPASPCRYVRARGPIAVNRENPERCRGERTRDSPVRWQLDLLGEDLVDGKREHLRGFYAIAEGENVSLPIISGPCGGRQWWRGASDLKRSESVSDI